MTKVVLEARNIAVRFGGLIAIVDMNFSVREGEIVGLIGPNGAGKTTAFNVITGYLPPTAGSIVYRGRDLAGLRSNQIAGLGVVRTFQKTSVFGACSVFDNVLIGLHRRGARKAWEILLDLPRVRAEEARLRALAMDVLDFIGLSARGGELASTLPYGEQRLLEVAIALAAEPSLLLLDEPVAGMNPSETASFMELVKRIRQRGITILLVEHDMRMVMGVSDRVVVLNHGRIIAEGTPSEIQRNPEVIEAYLGRGAAHA
jgi:branched-chain amino acid transport system ATP-binding protein